MRSYVILLRFQDFGVKRRSREHVHGVGEEKGQLGEAATKQRHFASKRQSPAFVPN